MGHVNHARYLSIIRRTARMNADCGVTRRPSPRRARATFPRPGSPRLRVPGHVPAGPLMLRRGLRTISRIGHHLLGRGSEHQRTDVPTARAADRPAAECVLVGLLTECVFSGNGHPNDSVISFGRTTVDFFLRPGRGRRPPPPQSVQRLEVGVFFLFFFSEGRMDRSARLYGSRLYADTCVDTATTP